MMLRVMWSFLVSFIKTLRLRRARGPARPSWPLTFEWIVRYLRRDWEQTSAWPLPKLRAELDARPYPRTFVRKLDTRDGALGGVSARWFIPPGASDDRLVLFFHGGSFIYGSGRTTHADLVARLALASGVTVIAVDYRLAPEHPFPAPLEDALAAFDALVEGGTAPEAIVVAGDSAGGNLAIELQLALRDRGGPQAAGAVLVSPWSDLTMPARSFVDNDPYDYGTRDVLEIHARTYAGDAALDDPRVSPVQARLDGLAPVLIIVGEVEIPRDDILALATRLTDAKVDVAVHVAEDMPHNPPVFAAYHPNGQTALEEAANFVRKAMKKPLSL
ncbi:MAG: alpha/beta hydrolase [Labilithrix sp.]|nr:alpha/beta hydrolase [Labilithrix sp.]MCW5817895.1 alpha/beta hydrolase [Labilithrix sp.]